jgi:hypothetical protein
MKEIIKANGTEISVISSLGKEDFISLTDIARYKNRHEPKDVVKNWLRNRSTIEFLGIWEQINNPGFKGVEFDSFIEQSGANAFTLSPKRWIQNTHAIGIVSKSGRYGGTYAHKDIAFEFASWISAEFKLYIIKDYQRLKADENSKLSLAWNVNRMISKINYRIHTDAVKEHLIPEKITAKQRSFTYANEADLLNMALFGKTAGEWREQNPDASGNIRDNATVQQLIVLSNLESMNAELINDKIPQGDRLIRLNDMAIRQMKSLVENDHVKKLEKDQKKEKPEIEE